MNPDTNSMIMSLLPFILISAPFVFVNFYLARRIGKSTALWVVLSLIPVFNMVFVSYTLYRTMFSILDRLAALEGAGIPSERRSMR